MLVGGHQREPARDRVEGAVRERQQHVEVGFEELQLDPRGGCTPARLLEPLAYLNIQIGYVLKMGPQIGFALLRARARS